MRDLLRAAPEPPGTSFDWQGLLREHACLQAMVGCEQDPEHHAEGDVATHTRMVCEALLELPAYRAQPADARAVLFAAAILHDVAKPVCTVHEGGRIRAPYHAPRGAVMARELLWRLGAPFPLRERVTALIQHHQVPFYCLERDDPRRAVLTVAETTRCEHLAILAEADARGRICREPARLLDNVALFAELCREHGVHQAPHRFASDHSRFLYFRTPGRDPDYAAHDDTLCEVVLMSGLPGSGKSHYVATELAGLPAVSLDDVRDELDIDPRDGQSAVIALARERARDHLRAGRGFVLDATSLSRKLRRNAIDLYAGYRARVRIVYVETSAQAQARQNRARAQLVPEPALRRMLARWQVPDRTEAHRVDYVVRDGDP